MKQVKTSVIVFTALLTIGVGIIAQKPHLRSSDLTTMPPVPKMTEPTLANGLRVVLVEDHWHPLVALELCYRVGARSDPAGKQGLAHLLEHLTFRSVGLPAEETNPTTLVQRAAATTDRDTTCYRHSLRDEITSALAVEAARMKVLKVSDYDLEHTKTIVIKERRQLVEGDTWRNLLEEVDGVAFRFHPYRFPTSGWPETIEQIALADVQRHFATYYSPANAVLVVVGDFPSQELLSLIKATFGELATRPPPDPSPQLEPAQEGERRLLITPRAAPRIVYAYQVPAFGSPDTAALEVVAALLSDIDHARLPTLLYRLAETVDTQYAPNHDTGLFYIKVALGSPANFRLTEETVDDVLWHLGQEGPQPEELERAKKRVLIDFYLAQSIQTLASRLAQYDALSTLAQARRYPEDLRAVTVADVRRVVRTYFSSENRAVGITGMAHQEEARWHRGEAQ